METVSMPLEKKKDGWLIAIVLPPPSHINASDVLENRHVFI